MSDAPLNDGPLNYDDAQVARAQKDARPTIDLTPPAANGSGRAIHKLENRGRFLRHSAAVN
jgi:hypothetical protein